MTQKTIAQKKKYEKLDDLRCYRLAQALGKHVWDAASKWDYFARDTVGKQLVRCADSVAANIAEGHGRYHRGERNQFLLYARGSATETWAFIDKCEQRALLTPEVIKNLRSLVTQVIYAINQRRKYVANLG